MMTLCLTALLAWRIAAIPIAEPPFSFTPDVSGMSYEERESYIGSIGQGPGGHEERK